MHELGKVPEEEVLLKIRAVDDGCNKVEYRRAIEIRVALQSIEPIS